MNRCETLIPLFEVTVVTGRTNTGNVKVSDVCYDLYEHFGQALVFFTINRLDVMVFGQSNIFRIKLK